MIKAIIIDDELKGATLLQRKLGAFTDTVVVERIFTDPQQALQEVPLLKPDLVFLDVEMPSMNGFELLENLGKIDFEIIFVTAYNIYTLEALRADALDYLLKPVDPEELLAALGKASKRIEWKNQRTPLHTDQEKNNSSRLALSTSEGIYFVKKDEIVKVEAMSNYAVFYFSTGNKIIVSKTLKEFEDPLGGHCFLRVNRSTIINLTYVILYRRGDGGTVQLADGTEVEVSPAKKNLLIDRLFRS